MNLVIVAIGILGSIITRNYLPVIGSTVLCLMVQEAMIYDLHRHVLFLEDRDA